MSNVPRGIALFVGKEMEVSIKTTFTKTGKIGKEEDFLCYDEKITPEQEALLDEPNSRQYPTIQELFEGKDTQKNLDEQKTEAANFASFHGAQFPAKCYVHRFTGYYIIVSYGLGLYRRILNSNIV